MNRTEYMDQLKEALASFDEGVAAEIISDYEEHFEMGAAEGKSEEEIAAELGSIDELVKELKGLSSEEGKKDYSFNDMFANGININAAEVTEALRKGMDMMVSGMGKLAGELGIVFTNVSDNIKAKQEVKSTPPKAEDSAVVDIFDNGDTEAAVEDGTRYADGTEEDIFCEDATGSAAYGNKDGESEGSASTKGGIDSVIIEGGCADVILFYSPEGTVTFDYRNEGNQNQQLAYRFYHRVEGNVIRAGVQKVDAVSGFFNRLATPDITLRVGIPTGLKKISIRNTSGNISYEDLHNDGRNAGFSLGSVTMTTVSGDVEIDPVEFGELTINTASGDLDIDGLVSGGVNVNTASGDIEIVGSEFDDFKANTASGDISITGSCGKLKIHAVSGDIEAHLMETEAADITGVSGDISLELEDITGYTANVKTTSGDISLCLGNEERNNINKGIYTLGDGSVKLSLTTVSGDIEVK